MSVMSISGADGEREIHEAGLDYPALVAKWVGETIPELEAAICTGEISQLVEKPEIEEILGKDITALYQAIAQAKTAHDPVFRRGWTNLLLEDFQLALRPPRKLFKAKSLLGQSEVDNWLVGRNPPPLSVGHYQGEVALRFEQALSARRWGIWFEFNDELLARVYSLLLVQSALKRLSSNLKNLWNIEATFLSGQSNLSSEAKWNIEATGRRFEHLMLDVLNEFGPHASYAPLAEDILERTDIRVRFPSIKRKHGARIQVSLTADPENHRRKIGAMYLHHEYICLTPLDLAMCAFSPPSVPLFKDFPWNEFWDSLGGKHPDVNALARALHELFIDALSFSVLHPFGPMWLLPSTLRKLIRVFAEQGAIETTLHVRAREATGWRRVGSVDTFTRKQKI